MVRMVNGGEQDEARVHDRLEKLRPQLDETEPPSTYTSRMLVATMDLLGITDPFQEVKEEQNRRAAELATRFDAELDRCDSPLYRALILAAAGNVIDVGPQRRFDIQKQLQRLAFARDDSGLLLERLAKAKRVMFILDNAGEVFFDRLLLKRLPEVELTIVARSAPILNDITVTEAAALGLGELGRLIGTGSRYLGVDLKTVSAEFRESYYQADLVIAKGHANFESLVEEGRDGFYLLAAKCELVAERLGVKPGDLVCCYSPGKGERCV